MVLLSVLWSLKKFSRRSWNLIELALLIVISNWKTLLKVPTICDLVCSLLFSRNFKLIKNGMRPQTAITNIFCHNLQLRKKRFNLKMIRLFFSFHPHFKFRYIYDKLKSCLKTETQM